MWFFGKSKAKKKAEEHLKKQLEEENKKREEELKTKEVSEDKTVKIVDKKTVETKKEPAKVQKPAKYHISQNKDENSPKFKHWRVRKQGSKKTIKYFATQKEAIAYADELADKAETSIVIHKTDGLIRKQNYRKKNEKTEENVVSTTEEVENNNLNEVNLDETVVETKQTEE